MNHVTLKLPGQEGGGAVVTRNRFNKSSNHLVIFCLFSNGTSVTIVK